MVCIKNNGFQIITIVIVGLSLLSSCSGELNEVQIESLVNEQGSHELVVSRKKEAGQGGAGMYTETQVNLSAKQKGDALLFNWIYGRTEALKGQVSPREQEIINVYEGMVFELEVKDQQIELLNYPAVRKELESLFLKAYRIDSVSDKSGMYAEVQQMFKSKASTSQSLLSSFFPEIPLLFTTLGSTLEHNSIVVTDSISSPYQQDVIHLISKVSIEKMEDEIEIIRTDSIPPAVLQEQLQKYIQNVFGDKAASIPFDQMPQFNYRAVYAYWLNDDAELNEVEKTMYISNGGRAMKNTIAVEIK